MEKSWKSHGNSLLDFCGNPVSAQYVKDGFVRGIVVYVVLVTGPYTNVAASV